MNTSPFRLVPSYDISTLSEDILRQRAKQLVRDRIRRNMDVMKQLDRITSTPRFALLTWSDSNSLGIFTDQDRAQLRRMLQQALETLAVDPEGKATQ